MAEKRQPVWHIKLNVPLLLAIIVLLAGLRIAGPFRAASIGLIVLGGALATGYVWVRSLVATLRLKREMRFGWARVGDRIEERFELANLGPIPALWVEVGDRSSMPGYEIDRVVALGGDATARWRSGGQCRQRGVFTLGPTVLRTGDPLGIFTAELTYRTSVPFVVTPPVVSLPSIQVAPGGRVGEGRPRINAPEQTVNAATVRAYEPGDSPRWIHWRTSAHRDSLYVRRFDTVSAGDWWVLLDVNAAVQAGEGLDATDEHAVVLGASLADRGLQRGKQVGLVARGEDLTWLPPRAGEGRRWDILRALALLRRGVVPLAHLLAECGRSLGRRSSLILITPDVTGAWIEPLLSLARRDIVPTVLLLDAATYGGGRDGAGTSQVSTSRTAATLSGLGIAHQIIESDVLARSELAPGTQGHWEWRVLGTGHAVPVQQPADTAWKALT